MASATITRPKPERTLKSYFPILSWLPRYKLSDIRPAAIAAITVWALLVPEAMAYAGLAIDTGRHRRCLCAIPRIYPANVP